MLNREVCKKCRSSHSDANFLRFRAAGLPWFPWISPYSEHVWERTGKIACPVCPRVVVVADAPPERCPYLTEHVVSQDVE